MGSLNTSHCWQLLCTGQVEPKIVSFTEAEGILEQSFDEQLAHAPVWYILVTLSWRTWGVQGIFSLHCLEQGLSLSYEIHVSPKSVANTLRPSCLHARQRQIRTWECLWNPNGAAAGRTAGHYWWSFWEKGSVWGSYFVQCFFSAGRKG